MFKKLWAKALLFFLVVGFPVISYLYLKGTESTIEKRELAYFGPRQWDENTQDTLYYKVPPFAFTDQRGRVIESDRFSGHVYVIDFFFTHCQGICPIMTDHMEKVQTAFKTEPLVKLVSITVDPARDTVEQMNNTAELYNAIFDKWYFFTGDKKTIYDFARNGVFLTTSEGDGGAEDFVHSEKLILVDKKGHIRGYYNGTEEKEVMQMMKDIIVLITKRA